MRIETDKIYCGDSLQVLQTLPDNCMDCCVTYPPYYALRDYGTDGQIGREATPEEYVSRITAVFHEVKRVLTPEGTCWLNIADTYCGTGSKADHQDPKYPKGRNCPKAVADQHGRPLTGSQLPTDSGYPGIDIRLQPVPLAYPLPKRKTTTPTALPVMLIAVSQARHQNNRQLLAELFQTLDSHNESAINSRNKPKIGLDQSFIETEKLVSGKGLVRVFINYARIPQFMSTPIPD